MDKQLVAFIDGGIRLDKDWAIHCVDALKAYSIGAVSEEGPYMGFNPKAMLVKRECLEKIGLQGLDGQGGSA